MREAPRQPPSSPRPGGVRAGIAASPLTKGRLPLSCKGARSPRVPLQPDPAPRLPTLCSSLRHSRSSFNQGRPWGGQASPLNSVCHGPSGPGCWQEPLLPTEDTTDGLPCPPTPQVLAPLHHKSLSSYSTSPWPLPYKFLPPGQGSDLTPGRLSMLRMQTSTGSACGTGVWHPPAAVQPPAPSLGHSSS